MPTRAGPGGGGWAHRAPPGALPLSPLSQHMQKMPGRASSSGCSAAPNLPGRSQSHIPVGSGMESGREEQPLALCTTPNPPPVSPQRAMGVFGTRTPLGAGSWRAPGGRRVGQRTPRRALEAGRAKPFFWGKPTGFGGCRPAAGRGREAVLRGRKQPVPALTAIAPASWQAATEPLNSLPRCCCQKPAPSEQPDPSERRIPASRSRSSRTNLPPPQRSPVRLADPSFQACKIPPRAFCFPAPSLCCSPPPPSPAASPSRTRWVCPAPLRSIPRG